MRNYWIDRKSLNKWRDKIETFIKEYIRGQSYYIGAIAFAVNLYLIANNVSHLERKYVYIWKTNAQGYVNKVDVKIIV